MTLFPRFRARLASFFTSAEDPRQEPGSVYQRQLDLLTRIDAARAEMAVSKQQIGQRMQTTQETGAQLRAQARAALERGLSDVATLALQRRRATLAHVELLKTQIQDIAKEEARLELATQQLADRIASFRARQNVVAARYTAAEAQVRVGEALAGISGDLQSLNGDLERSEARTEEMQARADAIQELMTLGFDHSTTERPLPGEMDHEARDEVEADLRELLAEMAAEPR